VTTWRESHYAVVDVETTGLDADVHEIVSIGIVPVDAGRIPIGSAFYREVRPTEPPTRATIVVHGIRPSQAAAAAHPQDVASEVMAQLSGRVLVAHVSTIEQRFLGSWLHPLGWRPPSLVIDTDVLTRRWLAEERQLSMDEHVGLGAAAGLFGLPEERRHHALGDALTTAQLFLALAARLGGGTLDARRLARMRARRGRFGR
jgi:DNA polymerase III subunit epsilon